MDGKEGDNYVGGFDTQHDAAKAALKAINETSIKEDVEYSGVIFEMEDGTFGYTIARTDGLSHAVNTMAAKGMVPKGAKITANYHTHGDFTSMRSNNSFSKEYVDRKTGQIKGDLGLARRRKMDAYLAGYSNRVKYFSYADNKVSSLGKLKK